MAQWPVILANQPVASILWRGSAKAVSNLVISIMQYSMAYPSYGVFNLSAIKCVVMASNGVIL